ncbi:MAG: endopeptidase La [Deltaproteobacteria bacterium]|nr:endopeptidase La [Deltaproteobacteria bacterium]
MAYFRECFRELFMKGNLAEVEAADIDVNDDGKKKPGSKGLIKLDETPAILPVFLLGDLVPFPGVVFPLVLENDQERSFFDYVQANGSNVAFFNRRLLYKVDSRHKTDKGAQVAKVGIYAKVLKSLRLPDGRSSVVVQCQRRIVMLKKLKTKPHLIVRVSYPADVYEGPEAALEPLVRQVKNKLEELVKNHPQVPEELQLAALNIDEPAKISDFVAQNFVQDPVERLQFLGTLSVEARLTSALERLIKELEVMRVGNKISDDIQKKVETTQRQYYLREQMRAIRKELGEEADPKTLQIEDLQKRLSAQQLPEQAKARADDEMRRLNLVPVESPEHGVIRSYLEWIADLPWSKKSEDKNDLRYAEKVLREDHFGLEEIKERILEFLAVRQLNPNRKGGIICFAGPPGVGKTSLGKSIARALDRKFYRFSLGGMRDEAEIKGHRRTYVGAMPGRILQGLRQLTVRNPVFMLDEIDKMGHDFRGDPASAMLEVLDPEQNPAFLDHYLDLPFDLSQVLFICTANVKTEIPGPLLDRMEVIDLSGYIPEEKAQIAAQYLLPKQLEEHGLKKGQVQIPVNTLNAMIDRYTREAGVRELERQIAKVCRKAAYKVARGEKPFGVVKEKQLDDLLGAPKYDHDRYQQRPEVGVAVGLAWTPVGGDVLFIETSKVRGTGKLVLTGQIGSVMNESAQLALSLVRARQSELKLPEKFFGEQDLHVHFPAGSVPKDGPSAGVTITCALVSLLTKLRVKPRLAMTGEVTLRGEVLPVGGIREKVVAARRAGIKTIVLPEKNMKDVAEIPAYVRKGLTFVPVEHIDDVLKAALS